RLTDSQSVPSTVPVWMGFQYFRPNAAHNVAASTVLPTFVSVPVIKRSPLLRILQALSERRQILGSEPGIQRYAKARGSRRNRRRPNRTDSKAGIGQARSGIQS